MCFALAGVLCKSLFVLHVSSWTRKPCATNNYTPVTTSHRRAKFWLAERRHCIYCRLTVIWESWRWRAVWLSLFNTGPVFKTYLSEEKDKYSLWQTKINGCVWKCAEQQAAEEDVGCMDHMQPAHSCQWREMLTWAEKRVVKLAQQLQLKCWPNLSSFHIRSFCWSCARRVLVQEIRSLFCMSSPS